MDYVSKLTFEQGADFDYLKYLVLQTAEDAKVDIFDNIFDWSILLTKKDFSSNSDGNKRVASSKNLYTGSKNDSSRASINQLEVHDRQRQSEKAKNFTFRTYEDVKQVIYRAYNQLQKRQAVVANRDKEKVKIAKPDLLSEEGKKESLDQNCK